MAPSGDFSQVDIPRERMLEFAKAAARACTSLCRRFIIANMQARGIRRRKGALVSAINASRAYLNEKRGIVRFRLRPGLVRPKDKRPEAVYVQAASIDAGAVLASSQIGARAKRSIKKGVASAKTLRPVTQYHGGGIARGGKMKNPKARIITRQAIALGSVGVIPARPFFRFTSAQEAAIRAAFRDALSKLVAKPAPKKAIA